MLISRRHRFRFLPETQHNNDQVIVHFHTIFRIFGCPMSTLRFICSNVSVLKNWNFVFIWALCFHIASFRPTLCNVTEIFSLLHSSHIIWAENRIPFCFSSAVTRLIAPPPPRKSLMTISSWSLPSATHNASRNLTLAAAGKMSKFDVLRSK